MVIEMLNDLPNYKTLSLLVDDITERLKFVNKEMIRFAARSGEKTRMGSTVVVMAAKEDKLAIFWSGDSRLYRFRKGNLNRLTKDHNECARLIDEGVVDESEAENHPSSRYLTKAVGVRADLEYDLIYDTIEKDDFYLLCTDGLNKEMNDSSIEKAIQEASEQENLCDELVQTAISLGGRDNVSIVTAIAG